MPATSASPMVARLRTLPTSAQLMQSGLNQQDSVQNNADGELSPDEKIAVFEDVLGEVEAAKSISETVRDVQPDVLPVAPLQSLNPVGAVAGGVAKERPASGGALDAQAPDSGTSPTVEYEPNPEIPPEVESFLQQVESHEDQLPQEIVISGDTVQVQNTHYVAQPVVVLPYTKETEKKARFKSPKHSIRWLVEFGEKIIKLFGGKVVYLEAAKKDD